MSNPQPGWYPDPEAPERQRFWDGTKWTEARAYPVAAAGEPAGVGAPVAEAAVPDEKRKSNPWIVIALIAVLAAILFGLAYFFLLRDSGSDPEPLAPPVTPPTAPAQPSAPVTPTTPAASPTAS